MKLSQLLCLGFFVQVSWLFGVTLPDEISHSFQRAGQRMPSSEELYGEQQSFTDYILKNWRTISEDIECLPPKDGEDNPGVKFNVSVIQFGYACAQLPPTEYVEFFEKIVGLYEQKRISFSAFENIYEGADAKRDFWTVNWEHPRVQAIFARIRKFDPPPRKALLDFIENQASGKLADTYMHDLPDDTKPPETLPGIKLQRPWASVIRKFEAMTGNRVDADPNFPDHHNTRISKRDLSRSDVGTSPVQTRNVAKPWWTRWEFIISLVSALLVACLLKFRGAKKTA